MAKLLLACGAILLASSLQASTIVYDSTGQSPNGADPIQFLGPLYASFSTGTNSGTLSNLELVFYAGVVPDGPITAGLYNDNSTTPGGLIADLGTVDDSTLTGGYQLVIVSLTAYPELSAGTRYWIGLDGETAAGWAYTTDLGGTGVAGEFYSNSGGTSSNEDGAYQMEVEVTSSGTPEPSTFFFGASMLAALAMFHRRRAS